MRLTRYCVLGLENPPIIRPSVHRPLMDPKNAERLLLLLLHIFLPEIFPAERNFSSSAAEVGTTRTYTTYTAAAPRAETTSAMSVCLA